jgi:hypothetical protein
MTINGWGQEKRGPQGRDIAPITLPPLARLAQAQDDPDEIKRREIAVKLAEQRIVRQGQEALETVGRAASFSSWLCIGKALLVGKKIAARKAGNDWGQTYSKIFSAWIKAHHFDRIAAPTRSVAIELAENAEHIVAWRDALPAAQRRRLVHPLSVTRRWRQRERASADIARYLRTFVSACRKIPPDEADVAVEDLEAAAAWIAACRASKRSRAA